jgi:cleavage and polyadenylation specificity factor subunit 1
MLGLFHELLPPSGVEFAVFLKLRSSLILPNASPCIIHLVVARDNFLRLYEIRRVQSSDEPVVNGDGPARSSPQLFLVRQHLLHGTVTGLASVRTLSSDVDGCDRLLVSYQDAKVCVDVRCSPSPLTAILSACALRVVRCAV